MNKMHLRLALYSDQECPQNRSMDKRLVELMAVARPKIGYLASAPDPEQVYFKRKRAYYAELGVDLSLYIDSQSLATDTDALLKCDAIHLSGGNTFTFSRWLKHNGIFEPLRHYARAGGVLIGVSAGAILMTPSIEMAALCGDIPEYPEDNHESLGLVQFGFWPHFVSGTESDLLAETFLTAPRPLYACPDGSGVIVDGAKLEIHGSVKVFGSTT